MKLIPYSAMALVLTLSIGASASIAPPAIGSEGTIPLARQNIFTWQADGDKGMWVQALGGTWYYGTFNYPCLGLQFHDGVGFKFGPLGELDKWAEVHVRRRSVPCLFKSFLVSAAPPSNKKPAPTNVTPTAAAPG